MGSVGYPALTQPFHPPLRTSTWVNFICLNRCATRALVPSWGQEQYSTRVLSRGRVLAQVGTLPGSRRTAPLIILPLLA